MTKKQHFPPLYHQIADLIKSSGAYLVGGAVRDVLLGVPIHDLDFALPNGTIPLARKVADRLNGDFYILDPERGAARVILRDQDAGRMMADFTLFQGKDIFEDLEARDFTITSMALDVSGGSDIIDPFHGARDLTDRLIRATTPQALLNDPLRCLRAVRLAAQLEFMILPETKDFIRQAHPGLADSSGERIRDELFRILGGPRQAAALQALDQLGIFSGLFAGGFTSEQFRVLRTLETFWSVLLNAHTQDSAANWYLGLFVHRLGRYREALKNHLQEEPVLGRTVYQLSFLVPLYWFSGAEQLDFQHPRELALGNIEQDRMRKACLAAREFGQLCRDGSELSPLAVYRFFRDFGSAGVEGIFVSLADLLANSSEDGRNLWNAHLDAARTFLEGWWEKRSQWVDPPGLLDGNDLQREFDLEPGPILGQLLEQLREAQVSEGIQTAEKAVGYLRALLESRD